MLEMNRPMFSYGGYSLEVPVPISTDHNQNHADSIFNCHGKNCNICEECLIRNIYKITLIHDHKTEIVRLPEFELQQAKKKEKKKTENAEDAEPEIGESYVSTQNLLASLLWSTIRQKNGGMEEKNKARKIAADPVKTKKKKTKTQTRKSRRKVIKDDEEDDEEEEEEENESPPEVNNSSDEDYAQRSANYKNSSTDTHVNTKKRRAELPQLSTTSSKILKIQLSPSKVAATTEEQATDATTITTTSEKPAETPKKKMNIMDILSGNTARAQAKVPSLSPTATTAFTRFTPTVAITSAGSESINTGVGARKPPPVIASSSSPSDSADATTTTTTTTFNPTTISTSRVPNKIITCWGCMGSSTWGCHEAFTSMDALKEHWASPPGDECLHKFIQLRRTQ